MSMHHLEGWELERWNRRCEEIKANKESKPTNMTDNTKQWLYFGCHRGPGHYLFREGMGSYNTGYTSRDLTRFDGMLAPQDSTLPYIATVSRLEGWGLTALSFWDYSVDSRGGCNSTVFAPSLDIAPGDLLAQAQTRFPQVFGRLPQPVVLKTTAVGPSVDASSNFQNRVRAEKDELDARLERMSVFMDTKVFKDLDWTARDPMNAQHTAMTDYSKALAARIALFDLKAPTAA